MNKIITVIDLSKNGFTEGYRNKDKREKEEK